MFSDSGLFGMTLEGSSRRSFDVLNVIIKELCFLRDKRIPDQELIRAKNIAKMNVLAELEHQESRLEEMARNYSTYGELTFHRYC